MRLSLPVPEKKPLSRLTYSMKMMHLFFLFTTMAWVSICNMLINYLAFFNAYTLPMNLKELALDLLMSIILFTDTEDVHGLKLKQTKEQHFIFHYLKIRRI